MIKVTSKIKAFTLNEMLVVLLITAIIVGMAFSVLSLVQRQMHGIEGNYERNTELNLLRQSLWIDFNSFEGIWYESKTNELLFVNELKEVKYQLFEDFIIKDTDTFQVQIKNKELFFRGISQLSGEIDALDFTMSKENGSKRLFVFKKNAATSYINQ
jgi:prepilin-type N-terminal cleavage/methylation domain-containing protein